MVTKLHRNSLWRRLLGGGGLLGEANQKSIGRSKLKFQELNTVLVEVEAKSIHAHSLMHLMVKVVSVISYPLTTP